LEACVLGLVSNEGPCTPYRVHRILKSSPSPHWSGSAGAVYPVFKRLEDRGLVNSRAVRRGKRTGRMCRISAAGARALRQWLGPPLPSWITDLPIDPLRTRLRFLGALPLERRRRFVDGALRALRESQAVIAEDGRRLKTEDDPFAEAMARGAYLVTEARVAWLEEVAKMLEGIETDE
jgi:DNA-binding PadR family transcriptional regulator